MAIPKHFDQSEVLKHPVPRQNPKHTEQSVSPPVEEVTHSLLKLKKIFSLAGLNWEMIDDPYRMVSLPWPRNCNQVSRTGSSAGKSWQGERVLGTQVHTSRWSVLFTNILSGNQTLLTSPESFSARLQAPYTTQVSNSLFSNWENLPIRPETIQ